MAEPFRVGFTRDFFAPDGSPAFKQMGFDLLEGREGVEWDVIPHTTSRLTPEAIANYDALAVLVGVIDAETLANAPRLAIIARYGVGYDSIDVPACTANGVILTITPEAVRRQMAEVNLTFLLALSRRLLEQDRFTRAGGWAEKWRLQGVGLRGKTVGMLGLGNIGREFVAISQPLGLHYVAFDPYATPESAAALGVRLVDIETVFREADFVVVACALTPETRHLVSAERLAMMKPTAYLISTARGPIVDQAALTKALRERKIAGAGIDVYEQEPVDPNDPLLALDNVILSPHGLALSDEWSYISGRQALGGVLEVAAGRFPDHVVNRDVEQSPILQEKLRRYREARR